jgi:anti-sigma-K factor RskA/putative zinc finger protein
LLTCEEIKDDLEAYALGVLDTARSHQVADHLTECRDCSEIVFDYEMAMEELALAVPLHRANIRVRDRILGGIGAFPAPILSMVRRRWWAVSATAVLLAFSIGGLTWAIVLSSEVSNLKADNARLAELTELDAEQRRALLQIEGKLNSAQSEQERISTTLDEYATFLTVALDPNLIPTELGGTRIAPSATCNYVWSTNQGVGALTCKNIPSTAFSLVYELWAIKGDKAVALGTFEPRTDGTASLLVKFPETAEGPVTNLWVTLEDTDALRTVPSSQVVLKPVPALQATR